MIWHCINHYTMIDDSKNNVLYLETFFKEYGRWISNVTVSLPDMGINAPAIEYVVYESRLVFEQDIICLELVIDDEDDENIRIPIESSFAEIFDKYIFIEDGYKLACIYSKHKDDKCFEVARIKIRC